MFGRISRVLYNLGTWEWPHPDGCRAWEGYGYEHGTTAYDWCRVLTTKYPNPYPYHCPNEALSPNSTLKSVALTTGLTDLFCLTKSTIPYRDIIFSVRDKLLLFLPVTISNSFRDVGFCSLIIFNNCRFSLLRTCAIDRKDSNQTLGSPFFGRYSPRAIAIVLFL